MMLARFFPVIVSSSTSPPKSSGNLSNSQLHPSNFPSVSCNLYFLPLSSSSFKCSCTKKGNADIVEDFSALSSDAPWDAGSVWSTMGLYIFSFHIPLSFGGLSVIAEVMHQPVLSPQTEAVSMLLIQSVELLGALSLLRYTANPQYELQSFFQANNSSKKRNWVQASVLGFGFLMFLVLLSSFIADRSLGPKVVSNSILKEILSSGSISKTACFFAYCITTPLLEETIYRGFLLRSLTSTMKWQQAVILSSIIFSLAHFSVDNSLQLFLIGCVLGCSYCWSGNLTSSISIHSLYNAMTLVFTLLS